MAPTKKAYTMGGLGFRGYSGTGSRLVTLLDTLAPQQDLDKTIQLRLLRGSQVGRKRQEGEQSKQT